MADGKFWPTGCNKSEMKMVKRAIEGVEPARLPRNVVTDRQR